jgi:hypothetical protein
VFDSLVVYQHQKMLFFPAWPMQNDIGLLLQKEKSCYSSGCTLGIFGSDGGKTSERDYRSCAIRISGNNRLARWNTAFNRKDSLNEIDWCDCSSTIIVTMAPR